MEPDDDAVADEDSDFVVHERFTKEGKRKRVVRDG